MRLLKFDSQGELGMTEDLQDSIPPYAILSHTWGEDKDEVTFDDLRHKSFQNKTGYVKITFCDKQAKKDNLEYFWVDTCCINKSNNTEYSEAINSMFRWYHNAAKCYVYLSDVPDLDEDDDHTEQTWKLAFRKSKWFTRGWTLQELLAPTSVEFFSREEERLGSKNTLEQQIHEITGIPIAALRGAPLSQFSVGERIRWAAQRKTKKKEDKAYCLLGIFNVFMPPIYGEGDYAFVRLKKEIGLFPSGPSSEGGNIHWAVARSTNTLFTGREDILRDLEDNIRTAVQDVPQLNQYRIVISGMGGQGKSEICLQLAQRLRSLFWGVFWVDVSTPSLAENGFLDVATRLKIPAQTWEDGRQGLANIDRPWMLVLDNADDPNVDYQDYIPAGSLGVVVLTSRNQDCAQYATASAIALEGLPIAEARELLLKAARVADDQCTTFDQDANQVAELLQSHPLALIQAGAYVARGHCTLAQYPDVYGRQRKRLLAFRPSQARSRYRDVYATFEASIEILQVTNTESARDALQLLPVLAVCGPSRFPLGLFEAGWTGAQRIPSEQASDDDDGAATQPTQWHVSHLLSLVQTDADEWDAFRLVEAVHILKAFALVSMDTLDGQVSVSMHALVHAWARDRQDAIGQHTSWVKMGCLIAISESNDDFWRISERQLRPHLQAATLWEIGSIFGSESTTVIMCILMKCGWILNRMRDDTNLFMLLNRLFIYLGLNRLTVSEQWVELYELTGQNFTNYGKVREAVTLLEQVVEIKKRTLAEDHPSRLASQHNLARAYEANGQVKEAVTLLEQVVEIKKRTLAEDHPSRLASQHNLARVYEANGQVKEAVTLLEQVVEIKKRTLAEDHPSRLASQHALAGAYQANGQVKEAVTLVEQVVEIEKRTLAEDHPSRLASQHALAGAYQANGQVKEAVTLVEQVVEIEKRMLAEDHPSRLASQHALAGAYEANGQVKEAVTLLEQVVEIQKRTLVEDHPSRLASQHNLARVYEANGQVKEAVTLLEQVVEIEKRTLVEDHPSRLASQHALARVYEANGQVKEAVTLLEQVVEIEKRTLVEDHPSRLASQHALAGAYQANGQVKEAVTLLEQVVEIRERTLAEDHPSRLASQHNLAITFWNLRQQEAALQLMEHVVEVQRKVLDEHHPSRQDSEAWLGYFQKEAPTSV